MIYFSASFLRDRISKMIPVPVRIWPMPAIPEMEASAAADRFISITWVTPRTRSMTADKGTPRL